MKNNKLFYLIFCLTFIFLVAGCQMGNVFQNKDQGATTPQAGELNNAISNLDAELNKNPIDPIYEPYRKVLRESFAAQINTKSEEIQEVNWSDHVLYKKVDQYGLITRAVSIAILKGKEGNDEFKKQVDYYQEKYGNKVLEIGNGVYDIVDKSSSTSGTPVFFAIPEVGSNVYLALNNIYILKNDTYLNLSFSGWETDVFDDEIKVATELAKIIYPLIE